MNIKKKILLGTFIGIGVLLFWKIQSLKAANNIQRFVVDTPNAYTPGISTSPVITDQDDGSRTQIGPLRFGNYPSSPDLPRLSNCTNLSIQVPYYNSTGTINTGSLIAATSGPVTGVFFGSIPTSTQSFVGTLAVVTATTSIFGVAADTCAANAVCYMITHGFAMVLSSGTINPGDLLVSSAVTAGAGGGNNATGGYSGKASGTIAVGTVIGTAVGPGFTTGGLIPVLVDKQ